MSRSLARKGTPLFFLAATALANGAQAQTVADPVAATVLAAPVGGFGAVGSPFALTGLGLPGIGAAGFAPLIGFGSPIAATLGLTPFLSGLDDAAIAASLLGMNAALASQLTVTQQFTTSAAFSQFATSGLGFFGGFGAAFNPVVTSLGITPAFGGFANQLLTFFPSTLNVAAGAGFTTGFVNAWTLELQTMLAVINGIFLPTAVSPVLQQTLFATQSAIMTSLSTAQSLVLGF